MIRNNSQLKILFYTTSFRLFRTTLIGHLYEICQVHPVVLLAEELDNKTKEILNNKTLFPSLKEIVSIQQFTGGKTNLWAKNRYLYNLAKNVISSYQPDIIILDNDMCLFEMYLLRLAKKIKAMNICFQGGFLTGPRGPLALRLNLENAYLKMPHFMPIGVKLLLAKLRKRLGHIIYYWILPLTVGQMPFLGKSSYMLWRGNIGMRDGDCYVVFSKRDFNICVADGVPAEKLYILAHPLLRQARKIFETAYFSDIKKKGNAGTKILTIMLSPDEISFRRDNYSFIKKEEILKSRTEIIALIAKTLKDWKIFIKPHPNTENTQELIRIFESVSDNIKVADQSKLADELIEISDAILGFPPSSTTIFTSPMQCPGKPVLSLDLEHELLGDSFKNFDGIEYIDNKEKLINALELIKDGRYEKKNNNHLKPEGFSSNVELIDFLLRKRVGIFMPSSENGGVFQLALSMADSLMGYSDKFNYKIINFSQESITPVRKIIRFLKLMLGRGSFSADNIDLLIYPTPFTYGFPRKIPYIVFIPNLMHKYYPNFPEFGFKRNIIRDIVYKIYAKNSIFNVVDSQQGSDDIYKFFSIKKEKSRIVPFVPAGYIYKYKDMDKKTVEDVLARFNLPENFIFYPAQFWRHKNHIGLVKAIYEIKEKRNIGVNIVFTGVARGNYNKTFDLIKKLKIYDQIFYLGYVSEKEIVALYKKSIALIFPSLFGPTDIPCLEAMVLGTPVVCSNLFEIPKQVGSAGLFFDPFNVVEIAERIYEIWTNGELRQQLIQNGKERTKDLTLENYSKKWEKIIQEALC